MDVPTVRLYAAGIQLRSAGFDMPKLSPMMWRGVIDCAKVAAPGLNRRL